MWNVNFNHKDPYTQKLLPLANRRFIYHRDAGVSLIIKIHKFYILLGKIASNIAVAPLLRPERSVQLMLVLDVSTDLQDRPFIGATQFYS